MHTHAPATQQFTRDRLTWLLYFLLAYYAYFQAATGPIVPFLRAELNLNYTVTGFHLSAFALGMLGAGVTADVLARRVGRRAVMLGGGGGMALGAVLLGGAPHPALTISAVGLMGFIGTYLLIMVQAIIADYHREQRAIGLTEMNILASVFATLPPLLVRLGESTPVGWRLALFAGAGWGLLLLLGLWRIPTPIPAAPRRKQQSTGEPEPLSAAFWAFIAVIFMCVSIEWCVVFWGADYLENVYGLPAESAAFAMSTFFGAMVVGRVGGSILAGRARSRYLVLVALGIVAAGFPLFWLAGDVRFGLAGLFVTGIGVANLFPLGLAAASNAAPDDADTASARISFAAGAAIFLMPQALGGAADAVGITTAFGVVPALTVGALLAALVANRLVAQATDSR